MLQICCINKYLKQAKTLNSQVQFKKKISNNAVEKQFPLPHHHHQNHSQTLKVFAKQGATAVLSLAK